MSHADVLLLPRVGLGFVLAYILGFERELRGAAAGNRTFALVGASAAAVTAVSARTSPQAVAGVVTGLGFIGAGVVFHGAGGLVKGITTAATLFATAAVGIVIGYGHLTLGAITALGILLTLELQHVPFLRWIDGRYYANRFAKDSAMMPQPEDDQRNSST